MNCIGLRAATLGLFLSTSFATSACPLCLGAFELGISVQDLTSAERAILVVPQAGGDRLRVVAVVKGEAPPSGFVEARSVLKRNMFLKPGQAMLLLREPHWSAWVGFGAIDPGYAELLRMHTTATPPDDLTATERATYVASLLPYLRNPEPMVASIAYGEISRTPYGIMRALRPHLDAQTIRRWIADEPLVERLTLYYLLLGIAGDTEDAARIEERIQSALTSGDATLIGSLLAADLELRGPGRMDWVDEHFIGDPNRTADELEAVLLALKVQGDADAVIPRERVIESFRLLIEARKPLAGLVAPYFAEWGYWEAVPVYTELLRSGVEQHPSSRYSVMVYLAQSQRANVGASIGTLPAFK